MHLHIMKVNIKIIKQSKRDQDGKTSKNRVENLGKEKETERENRESDWPHSRSCREQPILGIVQEE